MEEVGSFQRSYLSPKNKRRTGEQRNGENYTLRRLEFIFSNVV